MIGSLILAASLAAANPAPMLGKCEVSKLWGTELPASIPMEQERHLIHVQGKQMFWSGRRVTTEQALAGIAPDMALGTDMLVIDASGGKCAVVKEIAAAIEGPAGCTPERCIVSSIAVPARKPAGTP